MENSGMPNSLIGSEIHGFRTMEELDVGNMMEEAKARWLRPNEIHAILSNHKHFTVNVKPVNLPKSGTVVLFDRKMLRNFRKDGHNWKKKKDGKTVKEAHEHLKVGNEERIHVYYAHGEDNHTFVRRCYWLLDKSLENIVLVHYRETQELQGSPATPVNSNSNSNSSPGVSDPSASWPLSEESESALDQMYYGDGRSLLGGHYTMDVKNHEQRIHELNTLDWDELVVPDEPHKPVMPEEGKAVIYEQHNQYQMNNYNISDSALSTKTASQGSLPDQQVSGNNFINYNISSNSSYECEPTVNSQTMVSGLVPLAGTNLTNYPGKNGLEAQDSFGRWMSSIIADSPGSADDRALEPTVSTEQHSFTSTNFPSAVGHIFNITDVSPAWALSTEETKILVVGVFTEGQVPPTKLLLVCGDSVHPVQVIQGGVFRCLISPRAPGLVNLYLSFDGQKPISQVLAFEFRDPAVLNGSISEEIKADWEDFQFQMRLARLLLSSFKSLKMFSTTLPPNSLKEAKSFARRTSHIPNGWVYFSKIIAEAKMSYPEAKDSLFEFTLQNLLREWLIEQVIAGCKVSERDEKGQGAIHLCAILGYTWAVYPFACSGLSLDYRDKYGWTALHWAAYYGREKMVAALLSAGAKPNLVTDPTSENPGGCTAADLASRNGFDGLAAYLAEKALVAQFNDMTLAGNVSGSLQTTMNDPVISTNFSEDESYLKDTLAAYRTAADAAARIQSAFREHSFNVRTKAVQSSNPELEARNIVAAMKIQHAFRNYETRKQMAAAARIQYRFRTWKVRKDFLNMRRQAIKIQAFFRGFQVRKQYRKIVWSVGVLEKAILRWRLKRKGFRGLLVQSDENIIKDPNQESDVEEDFFKASRKQAEERVERSVVRVQAMFRSRRAQEEYRRMKLEHNKATLEYEGFLHPDTDMGQPNL